MISGPPVEVPFNRPVIAGRELDYIVEAVNRAQLAGDGHFTKLCQAHLTKMVGSAAALLTHSCTAALEMAAILCDLGPGDEVIMPSFTFVSTANAVVLRGATPVFVDIRPDTLNLDERKVEAAITPRTKAIFVVHYAGVCCDMDELGRIAAAHSLVLVEDAAQALGSTYRGRPAGSFGALSAFSFHETKNVISGEGGALCINDPTLIERAEIIREKGTNRSKYFRGMVDKYTWVDLGSSFLPGELVAAFLFAQLERCDDIARDRMANWQTYEAALRPLENRGIRSPRIPDECRHNAHMYYLLLPSLGQRQAVIEAMRADGVVTPFHYVPLHLAPAGRRFARVDGPLPVTEDVSERLVRLPLYPQMGAKTARVLAALDRVLDRVLA